MSLPIGTDAERRGGQAANSYSFQRLEAERLQSSVVGVTGRGTTSVAPLYYTWVLAGWMPTR
jgi:hypothetical protein